MSRQSWPRLVALLLMLACVSAPCACWAPGPPSAFQQTVDELRALQPRQTPFDAMTSNITRNEMDFDINQYFTVLRHLSMEPGYVLDYVYYNDGDAGLPVIYTRRVEEKPFSTWNDYYAATRQGGAINWIVTQDKVPGDRTRTDGTAEGYFEWVLLQISGGQFYLFWHAVYDDVEVVCDGAGLDGLVGRRIDGYTAQKARKIDFTPSVTIQDSQVVVRLVVFTGYWGGFVEETFTLSRGPSTSILGVQKRTLVQYRESSIP